MSEEQEPYKTGEEDSNKVYLSWFDFGQYIDIRIPIEIIKGLSCLSGIKATRDGNKVILEFEEK